MSTIDTMKARGFNGPTNGAEPVVHTDGNRMIDQIIADQKAGLQAQAHAQRVAAAQLREGVSEGALSDDSDANAGD